MKLTDKTKMITINGIVQDLTVEEALDLLNNNKIEFGITIQPDDIENPTRNWFNSKGKKIKKVWLFKK